MKDGNPQPIRLHDYQPPRFRIESVDLRFELGETETRVRSHMEITRAESAEGPLVLDGQGLELAQVLLDGKELEPSRYTLDADSLTLEAPPERFTLTLENIIRPQENTSLEGLYKSDGMFCTQCEAEGFRKITYFLDRPDVMARYRTTIVADRARYPVLLSNGNPIEQGELDDGRHWVTWEDPFPKPCYLFALVAGDLRSIEDRFVTQSGREVTLRIYVEPENIDKCGHAMASLKQAMAWDEQRFGLEYDLDIYMLVAVNDFNMGAMENKGLNIFNSKYVLARPETATDDDYMNIENVVGHEYFHNWTGNRVTCRDWFQLSLKEGLTVFRDQEFSADMHSRAVKRIQDVRALRAAQFPEDAGPMAHPVRPESYVEINNFYTATVYEKGAEVVRMYQTLLGRDGFTRGLARYLENHDGQAATTDDFLRAMEEANNADLAGFGRWYSQAGTPVVRVSDEYDAENRVYSLTVDQRCPPTAGQSNKEPMLIPLAMGLLGESGQPLPLQLEGEPEAAPETTRVLRLEDARHKFRFINVPERPMPSLLRGFSAPVKLEYPYSDEALAFLMTHDEDLFNRWDAGQRLMSQVALDLIGAWQEDKTLIVPEVLYPAFGQLLTASLEDKALQAEALALPSEGYLAEQMDVIDVDAIHQVREFLTRSLASRFREELLERYRRETSSESYRLNAAEVGRRALRNRCLQYLIRLDEPEIRGLAMEQFQHSDNMTDVFDALAALSNRDCPEREQALARFYAEWKNDPLVVGKWLSLQARSSLPDTLDNVRELAAHEAFDLRNPNKVRALLGAFAQGNPLRFHDPSGAAYEFIAGCVIELDRLNPQVAARLLGSLSRWKRYDPNRGALMKHQLQRVLETPGLSSDCYEIASKSVQ